MSKLLLDDKPLIVLPSLAEKVGLNESIVLQQLHYWLLESKNIKDGEKWVYNSYEDWQKQFPFWSIRTLKRIITGLETKGLIITGNYNKLKIDRTKWYRIDNEKLDCLVEHPECQGGTSIVTTWHDGEANLARPLPEITTENTTEKKEEEAPKMNVNPYLFFEQNGFGTIGGYMAEKIGLWIDDLSEELVLEAMKIAVEYGAKNWSYVERILSNWYEKKITSVNQVHAELLAFKEKQSRQRTARKNVNKRSIFEQGEESKKRQEAIKELTSEEIEQMKRWEEELPY